VAKIKPTSQAVRQRFRRSLNPTQQQAFDDLCQQLDRPASDLGYYHEVGRLVDSLIPPTKQARGGIRWLKNPAAALGPCLAFFQKALRFYNEYPAKTDVAALQNMGVDWTMLYVTFAVPLAKRQDFLRQALAKQWSIDDLRFEVQRRFTKSRHGAGRKRGKKLRAHGPEVTLRETTRRNSSWCDYFDKVWSKTKPPRWLRFVRSWPQDDRKTLRQLLQDAADHLVDMQFKLREVRRSVVRMQKLLARMRP
jgi:hypothetical protein